MHILALFGGLVFVFSAYMLYRKEVYIINSWGKVTGTVTQIENTTTKTGTGWSTTQKVIIEYVLSGKRYRFSHIGHDSSNPWKMNMSIPLHFDRQNHKKVQVTTKPANFSLFLLFISIIPFTVAYTEWEPVSFSNLIELGVLVIVALAFILLKGDLGLMRWSLSKSYGYHIDSMPENAEEIS